MGGFKGRRYIVYGGLYSGRSIEFFTMDLEEALEVFTEMQDIDGFNYCGIKPFLW